MKVLLIKDVKSLGKSGDICEVKDGYGRNFLIAKGFAQIASNEAINKYKSIQKKREEEENKAIENLKNIARVIENTQLHIIRKTGANGSLYGAITKDEIAQTFKEKHNIDIDKKALDLKNPIKSTGVYEISLKLGSGITAKCIIDVQAQ